jgi:hypothetical protein
MTRRDYRKFRFVRLTSEKKRIVWSKPTSNAGEGWWTRRDSEYNIRHDPRYYEEGGRG